MNQNNTNASNDTPADIQESLLKFPTNFPMKIMGLATESLPSTITSIAHEHFDDFDESTLKIDYSRTKKYMAVSIIVRAQSREQLDAMYRACTSHPDIKVVL